MRNDKPVKVVLVGDAAVGKTKWLHKVLGHAPDNTYSPTLGVDCFTTEIGGTTISIWDCAGTERYGGLRDANYIDADICIAFSRDDLPGSRENLHKKWIPAVKTTAPNAQLILAHPDDTGILHRMFE